MTEHLRKKLSKKYGKAEEKLILNGTGTNEPLGLLNYDLGGVNASSVTYDSVIDLFFSLFTEYEHSACCRCHYACEYEEYCGLLTVRA